jgi:hypothetical protein
MGFLSCARPDFFCHLVLFFIFMNDLKTVQALAGGASPNSTMGDDRRQWTEISI